VLGDIESLREIWRDAAVFVDPNDSQALKHEILELIANRECREEMSQRAHKRALEFTSARMAESYFAAYEELLATKAIDKQEEFARCA